MYYTALGICGNCVAICWKAFHIVG